MLTGQVLSFGQNSSRVARRINSFGVLETMADVMLMRGVPEHIRSDNGAEMTAKVVRNWRTQVGAKTLFIEPGSPWHKAETQTALADVPFSGQEKSAMSVFDSRRNV
jgi:hypothetical protein